MKRLLIIGCGDVATRALPQLAKTFEISVLVRSPAAAPGAMPLRVLHGDLDQPHTLAQLAGFADCLLHSAPPQDRGESDVRTRSLLAALSGAAKRGEMVPQRLVYLSTSGVYGDCNGEYVDETHPLRPGSDRSKRRVDAEQVLQEWCARTGVRLVILRVPGIYAADRLPLAHLRSRAPAFLPDEDVYTNHIHADDLAGVIVKALQHEAAQGVFNASDDTEMKAGDWFDLVADRTGLARAPRVSRAEARARLTPMQWSFLSESKRLLNGRMKEKLGVQLRYPTVREGVPHANLVE